MKKTKHSKRRKKEESPLEKHLDLITKALRKSPTGKSPAALLLIAILKENIRTKEEALLLHEKIGIFSTLISRRLEIHKQFEKIHSLRYRIQILKEGLTNFKGKTGSYDLTDEYVENYLSLPVAVG